MIPEEFSLDKLVFIKASNEHYIVRLRIDEGFPPILYSNGPPSRNFDHGYRKPNTMINFNFNVVYEEHYEEYKAAIQKLLIKEML